MPIGPFPPVNGNAPCVALMSLSWHSVSEAGCQSLSMHFSLRMLPLAGLSTPQALSCNRSIKADRTLNSSLLFPSSLYRNTASQPDRPNFHGNNMHSDYECVCFLKWLTDCSPKGPKHTGSWMVYKIYPKFPCKSHVPISITGSKEYALFLKLKRMKKKKK